MASPYNPTNIKSWSEEDRPREKLLHKGVEVLSDAELLAIIIGSGNRNKSAVDLCREILMAVNNDLNALSQLSVAALQKHKGIGEAKAISIVAVSELGRRRMLRGRQEEIIVNSSALAYSVIGPQLMDLQHEEFWILLLNTKGKLIRKVQIGGGGIKSVVVDKSILFKHAIEALASSIILVHNHPSGSLKPSEMDDLLTQDLVNIGKMLNIQVSDHIIVGGNQYFSYADKGRL